MIGTSFATEAQRAQRKKGGAPVRNSPKGDGGRLLLPIIGWSPFCYWFSFNTGLNPIIRTLARGATPTPCGFSPRAEGTTGN